VIGFPEPFRLSPFNSATVYGLTPAPPIGNPVSRQTVPLMESRIICEEGFGRCSRGFGASSADRIDGTQRTHFFRVESLWVFTDEILKRRE
jgi:hypothetical protein